jgi:hypothetical protein
MGAEGSRDLLVFAEGRVLSVTTALEGRSGEVLGCPGGDAIPAIVSRSVGRSFEIVRDGACRGGTGRAARDGEGEGE